MIGELKTRLMIKHDGTKKIIEVQTGEVKASNENVILEVNGIGSCVVIVAYDFKRRSGALAHVMLPGSSPDKETAHRTRYALDAIDEMICQMNHLGATCRDLEACVIGGGNVLKREDDVICRDNVGSCMNLLEKMNISVRAQATGGTLRRSVSFDIDTGIIHYTEGDEKRKLLWKAHDVPREKKEKMSQAKSMKDIAQIDELRDIVDIIIENINEYVLLLDRDTRIIAVNRAMCDSLGYNKEDLINKPAEEAIGEASIFKGTEFQRLISEGLPGEYEINCRKKDGGSVTVHFSGSVLNGRGGELLGVVGFLRDMISCDNLLEDHGHVVEAERLKSIELEKSQNAILNIVEDLETRNRELEQSQNAFFNLMEDLEVAYARIEESLEREKQLAAAAAAAEVEEKRAMELEEAYNELKEATSQLVQSEKLSAMGELVAGVAHELNQPLNSIKIICQSMLMDIKRNRYAEEETAPNMTEVIGQVNRMAEIIDHIRIYSRRTTAVNRDRIDVNMVVEQPFKLLSQQLRDHNINVIKELSPDLPNVTGDQIRLEQVMMNLITNARKAVETSGRDDKRIEVKTYKDQTSPLVVIEIKDNGVGIPENIMEKIFQPFFTTKAPGEGTGLGLSLSSKLVQEHKGRIEVESIHGEGATFRVILPERKENDG